jgi:hypothetical protein
MAFAFSMCYAFQNEVQVDEENQQQGLHRKRSERSRTGVGSILSRLPRQEKRHTPRGGSRRSGR